MIDFKFPLTVYNGSLELVGSSQTLIEQQILSVLLTRKGERIMRNNYGTSNLLFNTGIDTTSLTLDLYNNISNITDLDLEVVGEENGVFTLSINYRQNGDSQLYKFFAELK